MCWRVYQPWGLLYLPICTSPSVQIRWFNSARSQDELTGWEGAWKRTSEGWWYQWVSGRNYKFLLQDEKKTRTVLIKNFEFWWEWRRQNDMVQSTISTIEDRLRSMEKLMFTWIWAACPHPLHPFHPIPSPSHLVSKHKSPATESHSFLDLLHCLNTQMVFILNCVGRLL